MATLLETCRIPPPPGGAAELSVPLTFFDIRWLHFQPIYRLLFYDHPCSKAFFLETLIPKLKQSLSLTLKHYLPLSGNLLYPLNTNDDEKPVFRYVAGDSVSLKIAVSSNDFDELVGNHARDADQFYDLVPQLPQEKQLGRKLTEMSSTEFFIFAVDVRARINPPVPANYFGNCLSYGMAKMEHKRLVGEEGFVIAAEAIAEDIKNRVNNKDRVLKGAENWMSDIKKSSGIRVLGVAGSPKFDLASADFGWGRAKKTEVLSIDGENYSMSLCKSSDSEGALEVGLSLPKERMEAFAAIFAHGLRRSRAISPLTFFDIRWLHFQPIYRLLFYDHPCSKEYFIETIVPKLKESLSLTLKHYLPLAGNLLYPLNINDDEKPVFRYVAGNSVSLSIAESNKDFDDLAGNHARDADQFYDFVPELPPVKLDESNYQTVPVIALRITLFPGRGICIGYAYHHSIGDASSIVGFIRAWALITKSGGDDDLFLTKQLGDSSLPILDRSVIKDPLGIDTIFWKVMKQIPLKSWSFPLPTNQVRATFILHQADIKKLKDLVLAKKPRLVQVSSFVVTVSYVWTCFVKSGDTVGDKVDDDVLEFFGFQVDARARIDPPVPANYFGNCLSYGMAKIEHKRLVGDEGFVIAAEAIAEDIKNRILGGEGQKKLEVVSIDGEKYALSLCKSTDSEGGLEVGLSLPKERMEAFAAIFAEGLRFY
ncbi:hypothetical protein DH2020_031420 [Rehmannia glutinosa]|uniref:Uncharacterized protein n=1 Tax=Rehmannia glutinosa TaxID=99300 RepID=A0ABR0VKY9_REHGL